MHAAISCLIEFRGTLISVHLDVRKADAFNKKSAHRFYWGIQMLPVPSCHQLYFSHIVVTLSPCLRQVLRKERYRFAELCWKGDSLMFPDAFSFTHRSESYWNKIKHIFVRLHPKLISTFYFRYICGSLIWGGGIFPKPDQSSSKPVPASVPKGKHSASSRYLPRQSWSLTLSARL